MNLRAPALAAVSSLFLACGPLVSGELYAPEVCQDLPPVDIAAAPVVAHGTVGTEQPLRLPKELLDPGEDFAVELQLLRVELTAEGPADLGFIEAAGASVVNDGVATPLAAYQRAEAAPTKVVLDAGQHQDLIQVVSDGASQLRLSLTGELPTQPWALRIRGCYGARVAAQWSPQQ